MLRCVPVLAVSLLLSACTEPRAVAQTIASPPPLVRVADVVAGDAPPVRAVGTVAGKAEVRLSFRNGGTIDQLRVEAGAKVRRGQVLAVLNRTEIASQLAQASSAAGKAKLDFDRVDRLHQQGTLTQAAYDGAKTALEVAEGAVTIARYNEGVATLVAPDDGVIERRLAEASEVVGPGQPVYTLRAARQGLVVRVGLTDADVQQVHVGSTGEVRFGALPAETFRGAVSEIASSASPLTGTFEVELKLESSDARLLPGLVGSATLGREAPRVSWVPVDALVDPSGSSATVYALVGGGPAHVERRPVEVLYLEGGRAALRADLPPATRVVTSGQSACEPGGSVRIVP